MYSELTTSEVCSILYYYFVTNKTNNCLQSDELKGLNLDSYDVEILYSDKYVGIHTIINMLCFSIYLIFIFEIYSISIQIDL